MITEIVRMGSSVYGKVEPERDKFGRKKPVYLSDFMKQEVAADYSAGMPVEGIMQKYNICEHTVKRIRAKYGAKRPKNQGGAYPQKNMPTSENAGETNKTKISCDNYITKTEECQVETRDFLKNIAKQLSEVAAMINEAVSDDAGKQRLFLLGQASGRLLAMIEEAGGDAKI